MSAPGLGRPGKLPNARAQTAGGPLHTEPREPAPRPRPAARQPETRVCCGRRMLPRQGMDTSVFKISRREGQSGGAAAAARAVLTLSSPSCCPCTGGTWAWGWGWSPLPGTFSPPEPPGMGPSLPAAGKTRLQGRAGDPAARRARTRPWGRPPPRAALFPRAEPFKPATPLSRAQGASERASLDPAPQSLTKLPPNSKCIPVGGQVLTRDFCWGS